MWCMGQPFSSLMIVNLMLVCIFKVFTALSLMYTIHEAESRMHLLEADQMSLADSTNVCGLLAPISTANGRECHAHAQGLHVSE